MTPTDLRDWRKSMRLSQAEAAALLSVGLRTFNRWEAGEVAIPGPVPLACSALRVDLRPWPYTR